MLFDLDGFKGYNDAFGHPAGDVLLARLGNRLRTAVVPSGEAYRLGGDEFCVLARAGGQHPERLTRLAADALSENGEGFSIGCSYGIALVPRRRRPARPPCAWPTSACTPPSAPAAPRQADSPATCSWPRCGSARTAWRSTRTASPSWLSAWPSGSAYPSAAALHDVGKVAIPDEILSKPGPLTPEEWVFMRQHTVIGERILSVAPALAHAASLVRASHECFDGTGYPDSLAGDEIPIGARIIAACDAFEAMTADRPYRRGRTQADAIVELERCAGTQFDPDMVGPAHPAPPRAGSRAAA